MQPDRQIVLRGEGEERLVFGGVDRLAVHIGEKLDAFGAELIDGALGLGERGLDLVHRQRRDESRETVGMLAAKLGHAVIRHLRQLDRLRRRGESLDRRVGQRDDLAIILHLVHRPEARLEIPDIAHGLHALGDAEVGAHRVDRARDLRRQDVGIDIDEHDMRPALFSGGSLMRARSGLNLRRREHHVISLAEQSAPNPSPPLRAERVG